MPKRSPLIAPTLVPVPAAVLTFFSTTGCPRFVAVTWLGMVCRRKAILSAAIRGDAGRAVGDLQSCEEFALNLPSGDLLLQPGIHRALAAAGDPGSAAGLSMSNGPGSRVPFIAECPVRLVCRRKSFHTLFEQQVIRGEIVALHRNDDREGGDPPADSSRFDPLSAFSAQPLSLRS